MEKLFNQKIINSPYLVFDIQASHPNPDKGQIIEIGWAISNYNDNNFNINSFVIKPEKDFIISNQVLRITGITNTEIEDGAKLEETWQKLTDSLKTTFKNNRILTIIHFAQYEKKFMHFLHEKFGKETEFPFYIICTHKIVSKLFPGLPRKSIRASAGYFGYTPENKRRCENHVYATNFVWKSLVDKLEKKNITSLIELDEFISSKTKLSLKQKRTFLLDKEKLKSLPDKPGNYFFYNSSDKLLYVGKAKSLKSRVKSYFHPGAKHSEHIMEMISQVGDFDFQITKTSLESALNEACQIKDHKPPYNKVLNTNSNELKFVNNNLTVSKNYKENLFGPIIFNSSTKLSLEFFNNYFYDEKTLNYKKLKAYFPMNSLLSLENLINGIYLFRLKYGNLVLKNSRFLAFQKIANNLQKQRAELNLDDAIEVYKEEEKETRAFEYSASTVCTILEQSILQTVQYIQCSKFFALLQNAVILWQKNIDDEIPIYNCLNIKDFSNFNFSEDNFPFNYQQLYFEKNIVANSRLLLNEKNYDIMRTLLAEIKRIKKSGRDIKIFLPENFILTNEKFSAILTCL